MPVSKNILRNSVPALQAACLLLMLFICQSCTFVSQALVGYHEPLALTSAQHRRYLDKLGAEAENAYTLDSSYLRLLRIEDTSSRRAEKKNHYQPIQVLYFDTGAYPVRWYINCYAPGFPNLDWEGKGNFRVFPPLQQAPTDSLVSLQQLLGCAVPLDTTANAGDHTAYTVVFIWNRFLFRQCKRLHRLVRDNLGLTDSTRRIIYLNNDALYAGPDD
jgi:hypothetical protein